MKWFRIPANKSGAFLSYKTIFFCFKIILTLFILHTLTKQSQLQLSLLYTFGSHPFYILTIVALCYLMVLLHTWRWYRLNKVQNIDLSCKETMMPTYLGIAFNTVLPGSVGGDFVRLYFILKKFPAQKSAATLSILVDRINGLIGIIIIACLTAPYYLEAYRNNAALFEVLCICIAVLVSCIIAAAAITILLAEQSRFSSWLLASTSRSRFAQTIHSLVNAIRIYSNAKLIMVESLLVSMATQFLLLIVIVMIGDMMGLPSLSLFDYMLALVIGQIANLIPLTPGGIGVGEAAFANILLLLNPGQVAAYATAFLALRIISTAAYLPGVFIGIFGFHLLNNSEQQTSALIDQTA